MSPESRSEKKNSPHRGRVLLVDDDIDFAESLADILETHNYSCSIAHNQKMALELVESEHPNVSLIDIRLKSSSGIDLIRRMKEIKPDLIYIMVTAFAALDTAINSIQEGAYDYLRKPIEINDLIATLDRCFEKLRLQREKEAVEQSLKERNLELEKVNKRLMAESQRSSDAFERLRQNESKYRNLFESAPIGLIEADLSEVGPFIASSPLKDRSDLKYVNDDPDILRDIAGKIRIRHVNEAALRIFETADKKKLDEALINLLASDNFLLLWESLTAMRKGESFFEGETFYQTISGKEIQILAKIVFPKDNTEEGALISILDITGHKRALDDLEEEKDKFKTLVDDVPLGISIFDKERNFKYLNPTWVDIFGHDIEACPTLEEWMRETFPNPSQRQDMLNDILNERESPRTDARSGQKYSRTYSVKCKDGSSKTVQFRTLLLKTGDFLVLSEDVTHQTKLEGQFNQAQKMEAVGTLAGGIAHDFNNLLQAIQGYSQLLLIDKPQNDPESAKLREILKASERANELTKQLLTFSRKVESKLRPLNLNQIIKQVHDFLHRTIPKMISIELLLENDLHVINADPVQMEQVIINMAINARDAMPEGGRLIFKTANRYFDEDYCADHLGTTPGDYIELIVSDTGPGLDMDVIDHIFEPFFTTKGPGKGTGLGLSMAYGIIKNHNGHIECSSLKGEGTTFRILLPAIEKISGEIEKKAEEIIPPGGAETLLLVDDEPLLREIGNDMLSKFGYKVLTARDGETALEIFQEKRAEISIVILDLIMPGMGGKRCMDELLKIDSNVKIIISSGYSSDERSSGIMNTHAKGIINKPYNITEMLSVIRRILDD
ncbi:MAG: response regulator [Deltaproteobacteria bacterium]|nr:response regulator [Deltaproteobacteria bacterium]